MKKILTLFSVAAGVLALTSCGGGKKNTFDCPEAFDTATPVTVTFWNTMGKNLQEPLNEAIEEFTKLYPNVTVVSEQIGSYDDVRDQVNTNMGTGDYPSMAYCYPDHVALYNEAMITVPLDDVIKHDQYGFGGEQVLFEGPKQEDFVAGFWAEGSQYEDGQTYTMPFLKSTEALFYNKTFFENNKLAVPTTWEEVWATCAKIKEIDPLSTPLGYDSESNLFITLAEAYGYDYTKAEGDYFYFDNEGMRGLMKEFKEYFDKGYFTTGELCGGYTNTLMTDVTQTSRAYMCVGSTAGAKYQVNSDGLFETGVTAVPTAKGKELKCMSQGPSIVFFKKANPQEVIAAWLFTQYLLTPETQAKFAFASGYLPVTKTATSTEYYQAFLAKAYNADGSLRDIAAASSKQAVAQSDNYFSSAVFIGSSTARDESANLVINILGDKSIGASNIEAKIAEHFKNAIAECRYQAGL